MEQENKQGKVECQDVMIGSFLRDYMADEQNRRIDVINTYEMLREFLQDLITMKDEILKCKA